MARSFSPTTGWLDKDVAPVAATPMTMVIWFQVSVIGDFSGLFWIGDKDVADQWWSLLYDGSTEKLQADAHDVTAGIVESAGTVIVDTWHHAAAVFASATDRRVFLDGGNKATSAVNKTPAGADRISIGRNGDSTPSIHLGGRAAEACLWNVALTDSEIAAAASGISPRRIRSGNLKGYWPIFGTGSPEPDFSPQANHLTVNGTSIADHASVMPSFSFGTWNPLTGVISKTITDTGDPSDSISKRDTTRKVTDAGGPIDGLLRSVSRSLTDAGDPADGLLRSVSRSVIDTGDPTDGISIRSVSRILTDTGDPTDGLIRRISRVLVDTGDPTDSMLRSLRRTLNVELAGLVDGLLREVSRVLPAEDPGVVDAVSIAVQYVRTILDAAGPTDSIALRQLTRLLTDAGDPSDALLREVRRTVLDLFTLTDGFLRSVSRALPADDSGLTDRWGEKIIIGKVIVSRLRERTI